MLPDRVSNPGPYSPINNTISDMARVHTTVSKYMSLDKKVTCATSEDTDPSAHPPSLIRVFRGRLKTG